MASNFKEAILRLLSATNYSLDNLSQDNINSFEHLGHLKPLLDWLSQSLSEANCVTPEELEEFDRLKLNGRVKYGDELEEAIQAHLYAGGDSSIPFKESLNDAEEELSLLKEQLHYKQALHQALCSANAASMDDNSELNKKLHKAEAEQKEVIKEICSASKTYKVKISELEASIDEIYNDIIGLAQNGGSPDVSSDEGIHSLTCENINLNKSLSTSLWSLTTSSSWQTINSKDPNVKYMCQLSFDKYQRIHNQFSKRFNKLLDILSKAGQSQSNGFDRLELHNIKELLEKKTFTIIEKEAELEGFRAARDKIRELQKIIPTEACALSSLRMEKEDAENMIAEESFSLIDVEELATACGQWAEFKVLRAMEHLMRERIEYSQCLNKKMEEVQEALILKLNSDKILLEVLQYEKEKIKISINQYKSFYQSLQAQYNQMKKGIETMHINCMDYNKFCSLPLEERSDLVEQLAAIVCCDKGGVIQAVRHLTESSCREHETMYEDFVQEKNKLVTSGEKMEETYNMAMSWCMSNDKAPSYLTENIQCGLDQIDSIIEEINNDVREIDIAIKRKN